MFIENMIKRTEIIFSNYSEEYLKRKIQKELSVKPKLELNLIKWIKKFDTLILDGKRFVGSINNNKIKLYSKTVFYWPYTIIVIEKGSKTKLTLNYKFYWLYVSTFIILITIHIIMVIESGKFQINDVIIPSIIFGGIALFGRYIQKNTVKFLIS